MLKSLIVILSVISLGTAQINFPTCNATYTACINSPACSTIFEQVAYTSCTGSNGCVDFGLNYANIVSEYFCEDQCLNSVDNQQNDDFINFESCVSGLVTPDYCGVALTACQANTGTNNCAQLINTKPIADCINNNPACQIQTSSAASLSACYNACFTSVSSNNNLWQNFAGCVVGLGSPCYSLEQACVADQPNCGASLPAVDNCALAACPNLFNNVTVTFDTVANCYFPCLAPNAPATPSDAWTNLSNCLNVNSPSPSPSPSPSNSSDTSNSSSSVVPSNSSGITPNSTSSNSSSGVGPTSSTGSQSALIGFAFFAVALIYAAISF